MLHTDLFESKGLVRVPPLAAFLPIGSFRNGGEIQFAHLSQTFQSLCASAKVEAASHEYIEILSLKATCTGRCAVVSAGGKSSVTRFVDIFRLLALQPRGETGALLTENARGNIFHLRVGERTRGSLAYVVARWHHRRNFTESSFLNPEGWLLAAGSVRSPGNWYPGDHLYRYSPPSSL